MSIPAHLRKIIESEDDNREISAALQALVRRDKSIERLLNNTQFWQTKVREDFGVGSKDLPGVKIGINEYICLSYKPQKYELGFERECRYCDFSKVPAEPDMDLRRTIAITSALRFLTELKKAGVRADSLGNTNFYLGASSFSHFTLGDTHQTLAVGKINRACVQLQAMPIPELFTETSRPARSLIDNIAIATVAIGRDFSSSSKEHEDVPIIFCGQYVVIRIDGTFSIYLKSEIRYKNIESVSIYELP